MSIRFFRRVRIAPGVTLNLSKSGGSVSVGPRGAKMTVGPRGKRITAGLPGTGIYYTKSLSSKGRQAAGSRRTRDQDHAPAEPTSGNLTLSFFQRLVTPKEEQRLIEGCMALAQGDDVKALAILSEATHLADGAYLAGFLALRRMQLQEADVFLTQALSKAGQLGQYFAKHGMQAQIAFPVTDEVMAHVGPNRRGVLLGLVEVYQRLNRHQDALACLRELYQLEADDVVVRLSIAEVLMEHRPTDHANCQRVIQLAKDVQNESALHGALLLYKAQALHDLGLLDAARDTLTLALRRKKDRPPELLMALRYERARIYEQKNHRKRARSEYEILYAEAPDYEDVAQRLGL